MLNQGQHSFGTIVQDVDIAHVEDVTQCWQSLRASSSGSKMGTSSTSEMAKLRFLNGPALLARNACGQGHVLLCLVDVQAKQLLLAGANIIPRKALDSAPERAKIEALNTMSGRSIWFPRIAAVFDSSGEAVSVCTQGSTSNKQFGSEGGPVLVRMACQALVHAPKATSLN